MDHRRAEKEAKAKAAEVHLVGGVASWYNDAGGTACGTHYAQGVANLTLPCGTKLKICYNGCETAYVEDRGPYIAGRVLDLNPGAKAAIGCGDICNVQWGVQH